MINRVKHNAGFTLAEVLLAVAIILVLAAIAIPSVISAQNNMRMVELDNAAEAIANAAQTQMTAKKASGTWLALIEQGGEGSEGSEGGEKHKVKYPAAINGAADTYYMVASDNGALKGARNNGIIPGLSIDEQVRAGDFVIVFRASTASVVGVYYTDGKNGFFGTADPGTKAQAYYEGGGSTDRSTRMRNNPMIGYYEGTPAGATDAVALENPVIKVDEEGKLCVQNPNLTVAGPQKDWNSVAGITLTNQTESDRKGAALAITNIQKELSSFYVGIPGGASIQVFGPEVMDFIKLATWNSEVAGGPNAYQIDLEALKAKMKNSENADVQALAAKFSVGDKLKVQASITLPDGSQPFVPATAQANIEWPAPPAKLRILITDPAPETNAEGRLLDTNPAHEFIAGAYTHPLVKTLSDIASDLGIDAHADEDSRELTKYNAAVTKKLVAENPEAGRQAYSGGWLDLNAVAAVATDAVPVKVQATVGSYTPAGSAKHEYQIVEIWINGTLAGYVKDNAWVWVGDVGAQLQPCLEGVVPAENTTQLVLNAGMLNNSSIPKDEDGGYTVYVRTAPRIGEMQGYFDANVKEFAALLNSGNTTGARGTNLASTSRKRIENEFGAPSTVALWNITRSTTSGITASSGKTFPEQAGEMRIYYAPTPALGFNPNNKDATNELRNAVLWYYAGPDFQKQPAAMVRDSRQKDGNLVVTSDKNSDLGRAASADFEIPYHRDYLLYRVLEYCDQDGVRLDGHDLQYVPYSVMEDDKYAVIRAEPEVAEKDPEGWLIEGNSTNPKGKSFILTPSQFGTLVGAYDGSLAYGYVQLKAQYKDKPKPAPKGMGLMYLEFDASGGLYGYHGYYVVPPDKPWDPEGIEELTSLPTDGAPSTIASWEYRVILPQGASAPQYVVDSTNVLIRVESRGPIAIGETTYDSYALVGPEEPSSESIWNATLIHQPTIHHPDMSFTFSFSLAGAAAVAPPGGYNITNQWGKASSPWIMRAADQLPGYRTLNEYDGRSWSHYYRQDHDIDMGDTVKSAESDNEFKGYFDGSGHTIVGDVAQNLYSTRASKGEKAGLFAEAKNAQFNNVHLRMRSSGGAINLPDAEEEYEIGALVGAADEVAFESCTVARDASSGSNEVHIVSPHAKSEVEFGGLAGVAEKCTFNNSVVSDLDVTVESSGKVNAGSLIGLFEGKGNNVPGPLAVDLARNVAFSITSPRSPDGVLVGGIIGYAEKISWGQLKQTGFSNVTLDGAQVVKHAGNQK